MSWSAMSREKFRLVRQQKVLRERLLCKSLKEHCVAWEEIVCWQVAARRVVSRFCRRKRCLRYFRAWVERTATIQKQKKCELATARIRRKACRRLESRAMQMWNGMVNGRRGRMKLCKFFDQKREHALKMDCFHGWLYRQRKEKDLLRRVQYEAEVSDRKLRADMEMCERMMQRYNWRRYERQICTAFIGWHVHCVNRKHLQMVDHMFFKKFSDEAKKQYFTRWSQIRRFTRLHCGFLNRSRWRRMNIIFLAWRRNSRHEERAFWLLACAFGYKMRTKVRMALQRWLQIAVGAVPQIRAKLADVKHGRWYHSLLLRFCMHAWEQYVRFRICLIHSHSKIKCYYFRYWKVSIRWQRRVQRLDTLIRRFTKQLAFKVKRSVFFTFRAAKSRKTRLRKAQRLWSRIVLSKAHKLWKGQVAFERLSRQAHARYMRRCLEQSSARILKAWWKDAAFEKLSRSVSARYVRKVKGRLLLSVVSKWWAQTKSDRISRQMALRSRCREKQSLLRRAIANWHGCWLFLRVSRHARRRARCRLKRACMRTWERFMSRCRRCSLLDGLAARHEQRIVESEIYSCYMAWARIAYIGRMYAKKLSVAEKLYISKLKTVTCRNWNQQSFDLKVLHQLQSKSDWMGKRQQRVKHVAAWRHFADVRHSFAVRKEKFLFRRQQRLRLQVFRAWMLRCEHIKHVRKFAHAIAVNSTEVREVFVVWMVYVREHVHPRSTWAEHAALRLHARRAHDCFQSWFDVVKANQLQNSVNSLMISHTAESYTGQVARQGAGSDHGMMVSTAFVAYP